MYSYKTGIPQIDQATGGFDAGTNLLILAPSLSFAEQTRIQSDTAASRRVCHYALHK